jgi:hypothetical protein
MVAIPTILTLSLKVTSVVTIPSVVTPVTINPLLALVVPPTIREPDKVVIPELDSDVTDAPPPITAVATPACVT